VVKHNPIQHNIHLYNKLEEAFLSGDPSELMNSIQNVRDALKSDGNYGLAKQLLKALKLYKVNKLAHAYSTIPLAKVRDSLNFQTELATEEFLRELALEYPNLLFKINHENGMVYFDSDTGANPRSSVSGVVLEENSRDILSQLQRNMRRSMKLTLDLRVAQKHLYLSRGYVSRMAPDALTKKGFGPENPYSLTMSEEDVSSVVMERGFAEEDKMMEESL